MCPCPGCILALVSWLAPIAQRLAIHTVAVVMATASSVSFGAAAQPAEHLIAARPAVVATVTHAAPSLGATIAGTRNSAETRIVRAAPAAVRGSVTNTFKLADSLNGAASQSIGRVKNLVP